MMQSETMSFLWMADMVPCHQSQCLSTIIVIRDMTRVISSTVNQQLTYAFFAYYAAAAPRRVHWSARLVVVVVSWEIEDTQVLSEDLSPQQFH